MKVVSAVSVVCRCKETDLCQVFQQQSDSCWAQSPAPTVTVLQAFHPTTMLLLLLLLLSTTTAALTRLQPVWNDMSISFSSKIRLMCFLVIFIFRYACESWTLTAELQRRIQAMEMRFLLQDTKHLVQRSCYQWGSPCQEPAGNWTTRRPPDDHKETQTAVVWSCFPFIRSGQNHLARHSEGGRRQGRQRKRWEDNIGEYSGCQVPEGSGKQGKVEETGCEIVCGAPTTLAVNGLIMMMIMIMKWMS